MGQIYSSFRRDPINVLLLGPDGVGKTTFLFSTKFGDERTTTTLPTIGFNMETIVYKKKKFLIWDVGGQDKIKTLWKHYYETADFVIYMLDAAADRFDEIIQDLHQMYRDKKFNPKGIIILCNKMDLPYAKDIDEIKTLLDSKTIPFPWKVLPCIAQNKVGVYEAFDTILQIKKIRGSTSKFNFEVDPLRV